MSKSNFLQRSLLAVFVAVTFAVSAKKVSANDEVLKTEHGAALKVILRHDSAIFADADESSHSQPVRQFEFYFVLAADEGKAKTKNNFYRVATGTKKSSAVGWVKASDVVEWPHGQVLGFSKRFERDPAHFFENQQDAEGYLTNGNPHDAISREPEGIEILSLLPILYESELEIHGEPTRVFQVAYIHPADPKNVWEAKESISIPVIQAELTLDIVFVIDTTSSMGPYIEAAKTVIRKIAVEVNKNQNVSGRVRIGLVGYRDKGDHYTSKVLCTLEAGNNLEVFDAILESTEARGGGDTPEQVYAGVQSAISEMNWNAVANRHIILIGDAPNHSDERSLVSVEKVLASAQPDTSSGDVEALLRHITIHALQVGSNSGRDSDLLCRRQFARLAAGRNFAGLCASTSSVSSFTEQLVTTLTNRVDDTEEAIKGKVEDLASRDPNAGSIGAVLEYLGKEKVVGATFSSGYAAEIDSKGNRTVEPYLLVGRNDLRAFKSALEFCVTTLEGAGDPGSKDVPRILNGLKTLTVHLNYDGEVTAETPLKDILQLILGLPVKSDVFDMTPARLAAMSQRDFNSWVDQVDASYALVDGHIENARWFNLGRETKPELRFAFLRISDLP
ncbi:MAG: VWA domain-containing protein [Pirellulaceae bacterium]|nr:VWA domain-containing protein [Pirellulaceae bacterium]